MGRTEPSCWRAEQIDSEVKRRNGACERADRNWEVMVAERRRRAEGRKVD